MKNLCKLLLASLTFWLLASATYAQYGHVQDANPKQDHLKKRLTDKYKKVQEVSSTLHDTPNGPKGHLHINGEMKPDKLAVVDGERAWERGMAKGLLEQEAFTFGITNTDEIQERKVVTSTGYYGEITNVYFHRVINGLVLENSDFNVTVDATRNVSSVTAEVVPAPPELYEVTKKQTLTKDKIRYIIESNLRSGNSAPTIKINKLEKLASDLAPYVVWNADVILKDGLGRWKFRIDAFTGEILQKKNAIIKNVHSQRN